MSDLKLVLHVDQADRWPAALTNLANLTRDYPDADVRVVANGAGVYAFLGDTDLLGKMRQASEHQVRFEVCANALHEHAIDPGQLPDWAQVVPAGVVALAEAQQGGYAYIKP
ncbi:DsrE family protein [Deinococcus aluminii]|uniref:DsrE family protein n=1 Tax=Deinococcus aluminii TaxID=1656885 RepID=A0ABP9XF82_9DEIO